MTLIGNDSALHLICKTSPWTVVLALNKAFCLTFDMQDLTVDRGIGFKQGIYVFSGVGHILQVDVLYISVCRFVVKQIKIECFIFVICYQTNVERVI